MRLNAREVAPFVAFGYMAAAARGEMPPVLTRKRVAAWIESRPWAREKRAHLERVRQMQKYEEWFERLVEEVVGYLERTTTVNGAGRRGVKGE